MAFVQHVYNVKANVTDLFADVLYSQLFRGHSFLLLQRLGRNGRYCQPNTQSQ